MKAYINLIYMYLNTFVYHITSQPISQRFTNITIAATLTETYHALTAQVNPEKIDQVDTFIKFYSSRGKGLGDMIAKFEAKYGCRVEMIQVPQGEGTFNPIMSSPLGNERQSSLPLNAPSIEEGDKMRSGSRLGELKARVLAAEASRK